MAAESNAERWRRLRIQRAEARAAAEGAERIAAAFRQQLDGPDPVAHLAAAVSRAVGRQSVHAMKALRDERAYRASVEARRREVWERNRVPRERAMAAYRAANEEYEAELDEARDRVPMVTACAWMIEPGADLLTRRT